MRALCLSLNLSGFALLLAPFPASAQSGALPPATTPPPVEAAPPPVVETLPSLPQPVRQMLEAAISSEDEAEIAIVAKYAKQAAPGFEEEIDGMVTNYQETKAAALQKTRSNPDVLALWKGKLELGGFRSTGSTSEIGLSASATAKRQGLEWTHVLYASLDYRRANGETSKERLVASYAPRYLLSERGFAYGLAQYERDPSLGYESRYSASAGIGYTVVDTDDKSLSVDIGPSLRRVRYTDEDGSETKLGARSSIDFEWIFSPTLTFHQTGSAYVEKNVTTLSSLTALDAKLISVLTARFSYDVLYEKDDRLFDKKLDTLSKASLIYEF